MKLGGDNVGDEQSLEVNEEGTDEVLEHIHDLRAQSLQTSRLVIYENLLNADSNCVYFDLRRLLIPLSKNLRQQSKRRDQNYQSYDEVFLVVRKPILQWSQSFDELWLDLTHLQNILAYVSVPSQMIFPVSIPFLY